MHTSNTHCNHQGSEQHNEVLYKCIQVTPIAIIRGLSASVKLWIAVFRRTSKNHYLLCYCRHQLTEWKWRTLLRCWLRIFFFQYYLPLCCRPCPTPAIECWAAQNSIEISLFRFFAVIYKNFVFSPFSYGKANSPSSQASLLNIGRICIAHVSHFILEPPPHYLCKSFSSNCPKTRREIAFNWITLHRCNDDSWSPKFFFCLF